MNKNILEKAAQLRRELPSHFRDQIVEDIYQEASKISQAVTHREEGQKERWDEKMDRLVTHPFWGLPLMFFLLALIFWLTIIGANYPSQMLAQYFFKLEALGAQFFNWLSAPWWLTGFVWHGVFRGLAWVVAVMLPPMAIFFPLFTFLEDLGYLPRVAFNTDWLFHKVGAHGKQALTMSMGFGCNAAAIISTRIIESPRERLIAILTNNFVPCNGRFPTLIMLGMIFVASAFPPALASFVAAGAVVGSVMVGIFFTFLTSWLLSKSLLKGEASAFTLELPPYRRPAFLQIFYRSIIEKTLFVLWRAVLMAAPAGGIIWLMAHIQVGGQTLIQISSQFLNPLGWAIGLDGVILLAYIIAIPANEIVVPTIVICYLGSGTLMEPSSMGALRHILVDQAGWTMLTAVSLMLFAVLHNPCSTTILTIWKETRSKKWTALASFGPLAIAFLVTFLVASVWRLFALL